MHLPFVEGILMGLFLSVLVGPAFFVLLETSITKGFKVALAFDLGVLLADVGFILLAYTFTGEITEMAKQASLIQRIGGGVFVVFGLTSILKKQPVLNAPNAPEFKLGTESIKLFFKGLLLNALNPGVLIFWLGVVVWALSECEFNESQMFTFIAVTLGTFFIIDLGKIVGARSLKKLMSTRILKRINLITGIILIVFGIVIIVNSF